MDQASFENCKTTIDLVVKSVCRHHHLSPDEMDDLGGQFHLRLVESNFAILRRWQGGSSLRTYLTVVFTNFLRDWRNSRWGKWRPSAEAKRIGPLAVQLETLHVRDGHSLDEVEELLGARGVDVGRAELEGIAARLPSRHKRAVVSSDELASQPDLGQNPEQEVLLQEGQQLADRVAGALRQALTEMPGEDRLLLRLHFQAQWSVAVMARSLALDQPSLYRRRDRLLASLRDSLRARGITMAEALAALESASMPTVFEPGPLPVLEKPAGRVRLIGRGEDGAVQPREAE